MKTSLRAKLVRTMIATLVVVTPATLLVVAAMNFLSARKALQSIEARIMESIVRKGTALVTFQAIGLRDLVSDNAFGDVARLITRTVEQDEQLIYGLFLDETEKAWGYATQQRGSKTAEAWKQLDLDPKKLHGLPSNEVRMDRRRALGQNLFEFSMSVVDDKGTILGGLYYGLSDGPLQEALADARSDSRHALLVTVGLLLFLGCVTVAIGTMRIRAAAARITRPVTDLTEATFKLASGDRGIRVHITSGDELEILGNGFNHMASELQDSYQRLEAMNRTLEIKVQERTRALEERNRDMRLVLDNVNQGFLTVSLTGKLTQERSAIVDQWFGSYQGDILFHDYIAKSDSLYALSFQVGFEAVVEGILPRELCLRQMPSRLRRDGREYRCAYYPIQKDDKFDGLLIVINDVTAELLHARQEAERKEILAMFEAITRDRAGFLNAMDEAEGIFKKLLRSDDVALQSRGLHTLKGNAGLVGFGIIAKLCHEAESELADRSTALPQEALAPLEERWKVLNEALRDFLGDKGRDVLELATKEVEALEQEVRNGAPASRMLDRLASWWLEAAELPLRRLARYAVVLTARLGKGDLEVEIEANGVRLAPKAWAGFWADLVHVVRNAVDHGLETTSEREKSGKGPRPKMRFSSAVFNRRLVIEIEDYGRGVNWDAVRQAAAKRGLPNATEEDLVQAMFQSGVSTSASVTTLSGRGEGLAAVWQQVDDLGGHITVTSKPGQGTCFRFVFHLPEVGPRFGVDTSKHAAAA